MSERARAYWTAVVFTALAVVSRIILDPFLGDLFPFATLFVATLAASGFGGFGPGIAATALGAIAAAWFLLPPRDSIAVAGFINQAGLVFYTAVSLGIAALGGALHSSRLRAETNAREAQSRRNQLQLVSDRAPVLLAHCGRDLRFKFVNRPYASRFGLEPRDLVGKKIGEVLGEEAYLAIRDRLEEALAGRAVEFETEVPYRDLGKQFVRCAYEPEIDGAGNVVGVVCAITNISDRRRAEEALRDEAEINETLYRIGTAVSAELELQKVVQLVTDETTSLTGAAFGAFFYNILSDRGETYTLYTLSGAPREAFEKFPMPRNTAIFEPTFRGGGVVRLEDVTLDPRYGRDGGMPEGHLPVKSYLAVPVTSRSGAVLGGLFFGHPDAGVFTERDERLVVSIAAQASIAIDNARLLREAQESEERFRQLAENIREVFWISSPEQSKVQYVSPAYEDVWGQSRETLYDNPRSFFDSIHPDDQEHVVRQSFEIQRRGEPSDVEYRVVRPDGSIRLIRDRSFPIKDEHGLLYRTVGIAEDVTESTRLYRALQEADRRKDEFLALLGHELRNPLAPISNALHVLKLSGGDNPIANRAREMMGRQIEHLVRLVDDLLDVSRIMRGKVELRHERLELATAVARAVETAEPAIRAGEHELIVSLAPEPIWITGDIVRLAQVIANLLNNAAKYTPPGGKITLIAGEEAGEAVLRVTDTGAGIAAESLERIFDMFYQADRHTKNAQGGLGIGLSLVRGLIELHGGRVDAHSAGAGLGSTFALRIPLAASAAQDGSSDVTTADMKEQLQPRRILVVDDSADAADTLAMLLEMEGQKVSIAYDAPTALAKAEAEPPEIAFLDLGMPMVDGFELARSFRAHPALKDIILVALTGWGQPEDRRRTQEAGFDHHFVKPVEFETLQNLLRSSADE